MKILRTLHHEQCNIRSHVGIIPSEIHRVRVALRHPYRFAFEVIGTTEGVVWDLVVAKQVTYMPDVIPEVRGPSLVVDVPQLNTFELVLTCRTSQPPRDEFSRAEVKVLHIFEFDDNEKGATG